MSTKYLFAAMKARTDNPATKLVLIYLADSANDKGKCWPSISTIAKGCECSARTVSRKLEELIVMGFIDWENRSNKGFKTSNMYQLLDPEDIESNGKPKICQSGTTICQSDTTVLTGCHIEPISNLPKKKIYTWVPPTVSEVRVYTQSRQVQIDADKFCDFYESKGWMVGKNNMKSWQAAVRNWERNNLARVIDSPKQTTRQTSIRDDLTDTSWAR